MLIDVIDDEVIEGDEILILTLEGYDNLTRQKQQLSTMITTTQASSYSQKLMELS